MNAQATDIRARGAFDGTSMVPERREASQVKDYLDFMAVIDGEFSAWRTDENAALMDADLEEFRSRYAAKLNAYLAAHGRVMSQMITGAGGWTSRTVRSNEKRNDTADKRREELLEYSNRQLSRLRRRYNPRLIARAPISSDDPNAIERLEDKIERAEHFQAIMKEANAIIRRKIEDADKIELLQELEGISEKVAAKLLLPDFCGRVGFADYMLTNNNANIRRMKERVAALQREQETRAAQSEDVEKEVNGVKYIENTDANRVQLVFPGKPAESVRSMLKSYGFRWSPTEGAWQRQLNNAGRYAAETVLKSIAA